MLFPYMQSLISSLRASGRIRTAETYRAALTSFRKFRADADIHISSLSSRTMEDYQAWLRRKGITLNTVSFYIRILRAVYNRAVDEGLTPDRRPFRRVYTGIEKTPKRALPIKTISKIRKADLSDSPRLDFARDIFILSFMLRGMSFIDMAFLRKSDLRHGILSYSRRKTGRRLYIRWTREMEAILKKYPENESPYLLPIIPDEDTNELSTYRKTAYKINRSLKTLADRLKLNHPLTLYVARHSWASAAHAKGIPLPVISQGMGHDSENTTRIYLASLDTSLVDQANALLLRSI